MYKAVIKKKCSIAQFMELLSSLTKSGFTVSRALKALQNNPLTQGYAIKALGMIAGGSNVSTALGALSPGLKGFGILLDAAEEAGNMENVLEEICDRLKETDENRKALTAALVYPVFICLLALSLSFFLIFYGLPYINLLADVKKDELMKTVMKANLWLTASSATVVFIIRYFMHRRDFESRLFSSLYCLHRSGAGMEESFLVLLKAKGFSKRDLQCIAFLLQGFRDGITFYDLALKSRRFDAFCLSWLFAAEAGGEIEEALNAVSNHYKKERKKAEEFSVRLMEPAFLGICGIYVVILICGLVIPVFMRLGADIL